MEFFYSGENFKNRTINAQNIYPGILPPDLELYLQIVL